MKPIVLSALLVGVLLTGCVKDDDFNVPPLKIAFFTEKFNDPELIADNTIFDLPGWTNFCEKGTVKFKEQVYQKDGYAEFNSYGSPDAESVSWLVTPAVDITGKINVKCAFQTAMNFVSNDSNKIEAYASSDYDGTDVLAATWTKLNAVVANSDSDGYAFISSGELDLSSFQGAEHINIAFKATGSGTNTALDGLFQINNLYIYTAK